MRPADGEEPRWWLSQSLRHQGPSAAGLGVFVAKV